MQLLGETVAYILLQAGPIFFPFFLIKGVSPDERKLMLDKYNSLFKEFVNTMSMEETFEAIVQQFPYRVMSNPPESQPDVSIHPRV